MGILKLCRFQGNTGIIFVLSVILLCSLVVGWCHHIMHSFVSLPIPYDASSYCTTCWPSPDGSMKGCGRGVM